MSNKKIINLWKYSEIQAHLDILQTLNADDVVFIVNHNSLSYIWSRESVHSVKEIQLSAETKEKRHSTNQES